MKLTTTYVSTELARILQDREADRAKCDPDASTLTQLSTKSFADSKAIGALQGLITAVIEYGIEGGQ